MMMYFVDEALTHFVCACSYSVHVYHFVNVEKMVIHQRRRSRRLLCKCSLEVVPLPKEGLVLRIYLILQSALGL